ncbi:hypothetical protein J3458_000991 [Metarhizium acridum]|uniref:uncharacterized protein n=1 Tax=Metarhizium acridum TaxID=92637 RepID=UPI001C6ADDD5|nr:hypothetical protein J3458_000991 [Metarhizium acridum]
MERLKGTRGVGTNSVQQSGLLSMIVDTCTALEFHSANKVEVEQGTGRATCLLQAQPPKLVSNMARNGGRKWSAIVCVEYPCPIVCAKSSAIQQHLAAGCLAHLVWRPR